jgi:hypothetical protein
VALKSDLVENSVILTRDMSGTALDPIQTGGTWADLQQPTSWGISNTKRIPVITDHINQRSQLNTIDIDGDPAPLRASTLTVSASTVRDSFIAAPWMTAH